MMIDVIGKYTYFIIVNDDYFKVSYIYLMKYFNSEFNIENLL